MNIEEIVSEALFEARPYVEDYEKLRSKVFEVVGKVKTRKELREALTSLIENEQEPFKTDLRIFLQKMEALGGEP